MENEKERKRHDRLLLGLEIIVFLALMFFLKENTGVFPWLKAFLYQYFPFFLYLDM